MGPEGGLYPSREKLRLHRPWVSHLVARVLREAKSTEVPRLGCPYSLPSPQHFTFLRLLFLQL